MTFYQMLLHLGALNGTRILGPRTVQYVTRNHTGDRIDERFGLPMHRGLGVHVRGLSPMIRGLGSTAAPNTFGHGGAGTSYSWADPGHRGVVHLPDQFADGRAVSQQTPG